MDRESWRRNHRRQKSLETLPRLRQLRGYSWGATVYFGVDMVRNQSNQKALRLMPA